MKFSCFLCAVDAVRFSSGLFALFTLLLHGIPSRLFMVLNAREYFTHNNPKFTLCVGISYRIKNQGNRENLCSFHLAILKWCVFAKLCRKYYNFLYIIIRIFFYLVHFFVTICSRYCSHSILYCCVVKRK